MDEELEAAQTLAAKTPIVSSADSQSRRTRRKSNRPYPPAAFEEAVSFTRSIYEFSPGLSVRKLSFFDHLGRSAESSISRDSITNANKYGLLKSSFKSEQLELTPEAILIVGDEGSEREKLRLKVRLAIDLVDPFRQLYEKISGSRLPARSALVDGMRDLNVPEDLVEESVDIFIVNLRYVGLLRVLSGAERVVSQEHAIDEAVPESRAYTTSSIPDPVLAQPRTHPLTTQEQANLDTTCFYITPIGAEGSAARKHSDLFLSSLVEPAINSIGLNVVRADTIGQSGIITRQIMDYIFKARLVVADLSFQNPNVFYELALRHAVRLPVVQIIRQSESIPFDVNQMRTISIDDGDLYTFVPKIEVYRSQISAQARRALETGAEAETPISVYFPALSVRVSS